MQHSSQQHYPLQFINNFVDEGRISVFAEPSAQTRAAGMKGGAWVYATHDLADLSAVLDSIHKGLASGEAHFFHMASLF